MAALSPFLIPASSSSFSSVLTNEDRLSLCAGQVAGEPWASAPVFGRKNLEQLSAGHPVPRSRGSLPVTGTGLNSADLHPQLFTIPLRVKLFI